MRSRGSSDTRCLRGFSIRAMLSSLRHLQAYLSLWTLTRALSGGLRLRAHFPKGETGSEMERLAQSAHLVKPRDRSRTGRVHRGRMSGTGLPTPPLLPPRGRAAHQYVMFWWCHLRSPSKVWNVPRSGTPQRGVRIACRVVASSSPVSGRDRRLWRSRSTGPKDCLLSLISAT